MHKLDICNKSYLDFTKFEPNSVIYLDPPYLNHNHYQNKISYNDFYSWVNQINVPVYVSSYESPLQTVLEMKHRTTMNSAKSKEQSQRTERLFWNGVL